MLSERLHDLVRLDSLYSNFVVVYVLQAPNNAVTRQHTKFFRRHFKFKVALLSDFSWNYRLF